MNKRQQKLAAMEAEARGMEDLRRVDLGYFSIRYSLPFKTICEHLEKQQIIPTGIYDDIDLRALKVSWILDRTRRAYPVIEKWKPE